MVGRDGPQATTRAPRGTDALRVLREAAHAGLGGELVVRAPEGSARVYLVGGRVAWAHVGGAQAGLIAVLRARGLVQRSDLEAVLEECRQTGENFCEVLVAWGLVERAALNELKRSDFSDVLARIAAFRTPTALFVPQALTFRGAITYSLEELGAEGRASRATTPARLDVEALTASLAEAMTIDGAIGAALVDHETGRALATVGGTTQFDVVVAGEGNAEVVRAKRRVAEALGVPDSVEDILITLSTQYHLLRPLRAHPSLFLYLAADREQANLALSRRRLQQIEASLGA